MKVFRKIRQAMIKESNFRKYLIYAIGEILLIMIGILLALQVNNWNAQRINRKAEIQSYHNIKRHIQDDRYEILGALEYNYRYLKEYESANQMIGQNARDKVRMLGDISMNLMKYSDFNRSSNIYQNLLNSGELKLLGNREIISGLQRLEETYIYMNRLERSHGDIIRLNVGPDLQKSIRFSDHSVQHPDNLFGFEFQNLFVAMISISYEKNELYLRALNEIGELVELINDELNTKDKLSRKAYASQTVGSPPDLDLHTAVIIGDFETIRNHVKVGSNLNVSEPSHGSTPLMTAAVLGNSRAAQILIEAGADLNFQNNDGSTALHIAALFCQPEIVKALVENGADKMVKTNTGKTAQEIVEIPFDKVKGFYDALGAELRLMGLTLDYDYIQAARPQIAEMLR